jgi:hypothetical protein
MPVEISNDQRELGNAGTLNSEQCPAFELGNQLYVEVGVIGMIKE